MWWMCSLYKVVDGVVDVDVGAVETRVVAKEGAAPAAGMAMRQQMWGAGYGNEFETQQKTGGDGEHEGSPPPTGRVGT